MAKTEKKCRSENQKESSRINGAKSRGPVTQSDKNVSNMNGLRHGLRSRLLIPMACGDGAAWADLYAYWVRIYRPTTPGAWALLDHCFHSEVMAMRHRRVHIGIAGSQVEAAEKLYETKRAQLINSQYDLLSDDPIAAVAGLENTCQGCARLIAELERALGALLAQGYWRPGACGMVVRLFGAFPEVHRLRESTLAYRITLDNLHCQPGGAPGELATLLRPEFQPPELAARGGEPLDTTPAACRARLQRIVEDRLVQLRTTEEQLRTGRDAIQHDQVVAPNMMIADGTEANRFFRYYAESRSTFLRCFAALKATLKEDAARAESEGETADDDWRTFAAAVLADAGLDDSATEPEEPSNEAVDSPDTACESTASTTGPAVSATEPEKPSVGSTEPSAETVTCVAGAGLPKPPVEPGETAQEPPIPASDGRFLVRGLGPRLEPPGPAAPAVPEPDSGPPGRSAVGS